MSGTKSPRKWDGKFGAVRDQLIQLLNEDSESSQDESLADVQDRLQAIVLKLGSAVRMMHGKTAAVYVAIPNEYLDRLKEIAARRDAILAGQFDISATPSVTSGIVAHTTRSRGRRPSGRKVPAYAR